MTPTPLPDSVAIGAANLRVPDAERALGFYRDLLGLAVQESREDRVVLGATEHSPALVVLTIDPDAVAKPPRTTGLYHMAIRVPTRAALARLLQRIAVARYPMQGAADHLVSEALYMADPDGNGIELYVDRPREQWQIIDEQVAMSTDPLDIDDLLAQATDDPWSGIDPGTDIGHMHLHVSNLGAAEAFWSGVIGFDVMQRGYPGALFVAAGGYHHHLGLNIWAGRGAPPPPSNAIGLMHYSLVLPDDAARQTVLGRAQAAGVAIEDTDAGPLLRDPDRNAVVLQVVA